MRGLKIIAVALLMTPLAVGGCDFHEEPAPIEGTYSPSVFVIAIAGGAFDVLGAGGTLEIALDRTGAERRFEANIQIPEGTVSPEQPRIDTTLSGSYTVIVDKVVLKFQRATKLLPTNWRYETGSLQASGSVEIPNTTDPTLVARLQK